MLQDKDTDKTCFDVGEYNVAFDLVEKTSLFLFVFFLMCTIKIFTH